MLRLLRAALSASVLFLLVLVGLSGSSPYTLTDITPSATGFSYPRAMTDNGKVVGYTATSSLNTGWLWNGTVLTTLPSFGGNTQAYLVNENGDVAGGSFLAGNTVQHAFFYSGGVMHDIGTFGGPDSYATGMNSSGAVIGNAKDPSKNYQAFLYTNGSRVPLVTGVYLSLATGINDAGQVVGYYLPSSGSQPQAFLYDGGVLTVLGTLGGNSSQAIAINNAGDIIGNSQGTDGRQHSFLYSGGHMIDIGPVSAGGASYTVALNDAAQVVGYDFSGGSTYTAYLYDHGLKTPLTLGGTYSYARAINAAGHVIGEADLPNGTRHPFLYDGTMHDLGTLGGSYGATSALNDNDEVTGYSFINASTDHAFVYRNGTMTDLGTLGGPWSEGYLINSSGLIAGLSSLSTSSTGHAFIVQPIATTTLAVAAVSTTFGGNTTVSATLTAGGNGVAGRSISFELNGNAVGSAVTDATGTAQLSAALLQTIGAGSYPAGVHASFAGDTDYLASDDDAALTVGKATPDLQVSPSSVPYDGLPHGVTAQALGVFAELLTPTTLTYNGSTTPPTSAGTYTALLSFTGDGNYLPASASALLKITQRSLTVTASDASRLYGGANPGFSASYAGFANGENESVLGGALQLATAADQFSAVGTYAIIPSGLTSNDYDIAFVNGTLHVTPAALTVKANDATREYGLANPSFDVAYAGFVAGEGPSALGGSLAFSTPADPSSGIGGYPITPSGLTSSNYAIAFQDGMLQITPASLTVAAGDATRLYGAANPALTGTVAGIRNSDSITATFATTATTTSPVGDYAITSSLNDPSGRLGNYTVTQHNGTLHVTPAPLTVRAQDAARLYGQANPTFGVGYEGLVAGDLSAALGGTLSIATPADANSPVGTYSIVPSGLTSTNYTIAFANGTLTVSRAMLDITAQNAAREYGLPNPAFDVAYSGFVNGESPAALAGVLTETTPAIQGSPIGSYPITPAGLSSGNYDIHYHDGTLTIATAPLALTVNNATRTYGAADPMFAGTIAGIRNGDAISATYSTPATATSGTGTYPINGALSGAALGNYSQSVVPGTLTITPAALVVKANDASKLQGAPNPPFAATFTGLVLGEMPSVLGGSLTFTTPATTSSGAGTYPITPGGVTSPNYTISFVDGTLVVSYNVCALFDQTKANKAGSTVPIKLALCDASGTNVSSAAVALTATGLNRMSDGTSADVQDPGNADPDSNFRFDSGIYQFNLKTTGLASGTWQLGFKVTGDPVPHAVLFQVR